MDKENSNSIALSPPMKKTRKEWKTNPNAPVPRSTVFRWQRLRKLNQERDHANIQPPESVSSIPDCDVCSLSSLSDDDNESSDCRMENENDVSDDYTNEVMSNVSDHSANESESDVFELNDLISNGSEYSDDEDTSVHSLEPEGVNYMSSIVNLLYNTSDISVTQAVLMILNFYVRNKLTKTGLQDLLTTVHTLLPKDNKLPKTRHQLFKFVENAASSYCINKHYYYNKCLFYYGTSVEVEVCDYCSSTNGTSFFFEIDLADIIKDMFEKRNLVSKLHLSEHQENLISDITDGSEYIRIDSRPDRNKFDLTLMLNTDGISLVKSSKSHCWPLMFMIIQLPEYLRESFIGIMGLWYDTNQKPYMNTFFQPFCEKLRKLYYEGIKWTDPLTQKVHVSRVIAPLFIADAPARAEIQNISYFSGKYGCNICEIKTKRCPREEGQKKAVRAYIFSEEDRKLRTSDRMEQQAEFAQKYDLPYKRGVKGISVISDLPFLDLSTCFVPEYMHSVLLGVGKQFVNLWLKKKGNWSVSKKIKEIDKTLLDVCPPHFFNRMPRSLTNLAYYKASEFYNLILFYSIPIFNGHLPDIYLQHWMLFVVAIFKLLQKPIQIHPDLEQAEILLRLFVRDIKDLYGRTQYTYNVHQLLHLTLCIKRWGPLWSTSAFPFENFNGVLSTCVHGSKHLGQEIVNNLKIMQGWQNLRAISAGCHDTSVRSDSREFEMFNKINMSKLKDDELIKCIQSLSVNPDNVHCFVRCRIGKDHYTSESYKIIKTNSYTVEIEVNNEVIYGAIQIFTKINTELGFILKPFNVDINKMFCHRETDTQVSHILPIEEKFEYIYIKANNTRCITHVIRITDCICKRPNKLNKVM